MKEALKSFYYYILRHYWDIGFVSFENGDIRSNWSYSFIKHNYKDRYFADPFILEVKEDTIELLVEECRYKKPKRGRIAKLIVDKHSLELKDMIVVLDGETHLSFPEIIRTEDSVFVCPESAEGCKCVLYRFDPHFTKLERVKTLVEEPLSDAILYNGFDKPCIIATKAPTSTSNIIEFYESDSVCGIYHHKASVTIPTKAARGAGDFFAYNNETFRPGQVFSEKNGYGVGLSFQLIQKDTTGYKVEELFQKYPPKGYVGMHTFNNYKGLFVVDCRRYKRPAIAKLLKMTIRGVKHIFS